MDIRRHFDRNSFNGKSRRSLFGFIIRLCNASLFFLRVFFLTLQKPKKRVFGSVYIYYFDIFFRTSKSNQVRADHKCEVKQFSRTCRWRFDIRELENLLTLQVALAENALGKIIDQLPAHDHRTLYFPNPLNFQYESDGSFNLLQICLRNNASVLLILRANKHGQFLQFNVMINPHGEKSVNMINSPRFLGETCLPQALAQCSHDFRQF